MVSIGSMGCWCFEKLENQNKDVDCLSPGKMFEVVDSYENNSVGYSCLVLFSLSRCRTRDGYCWGPSVLGTVSWTVLGTMSGMVSGTVSGTVLGTVMGTVFVSVGGGDGSFWCSCPSMGVTVLVQMSFRVDSSLVRERRGCLVGGNVGRSDRQQQYYLPVLASLWSMVDGQRRCSVVGQLGDSQQQYYL